MIMIHEDAIDDDDDDASPSSSTSLPSNGKREVNTFPPVHCLTSAFRQQTKQVFRIRVAVESTFVLGSITRRLVFTLLWLCERDATTSRILIETETVGRNKKRTKSKKKERIWNLADCWFQLVCELWVASVRAAVFNSLKLYLFSISCHVHWLKITFGVKLTISIAHRQRLSLSITLNSLITSDKPIWTFNDRRIKAKRGRCEIKCFSRMCERLVSSTSLVDVKRSPPTVQLTY